MYINSGYLNNSRLPFKDKSKPLIVGSCGTYRLQTVKKMPTWRPRGRLDYQLLYVVSGKAHFYFGDEEQTVTAGHMVLFQPRQEQHYEYFGTDKPEVYWVHFTGSNVKNILRKYEIPLEHYHEQISIEDYARSRNMSVSWFQRSFKQIVKHSPMQYILTIRMNNAASLLDATDYSMSEISAIVGYDNPLYFSRVFKKQKGVSPSEYRKLGLKKE